MISNNKEKYTKFNAAENGDYYFSLFDLLQAFYKRKFIFIIVFIIGFVAAYIYLSVNPALYRIEQRVNFEPESLILNTSPHLDTKLRLSLINELLNNKVVLNKIKKVLSDESFANNLAKNIKFKHFHEGKLESIIIYTETDQPKTDIKSFQLNIENLNKKVSSSLKTRIIEEVNQKIIAEENEIKYLLYKMELKQAAKIILLEEAREIALDLGIIDPVYINVDVKGEGYSEPLWTFGTEYLKAEINILSKRENDEAFIYLQNPELTKVKLELEYYKNFDPSIIELIKTPSFGKYLAPKNKDELLTIIQFLELELEANVSHIKKTRMARIDLLKENYEFANTIGIKKPTKIENYWDKERKWKSHSLRVSSSFNSLIEEREIMLKTLIGTKHLTALITALQNRDNSKFSEEIINIETHLTYLKNALNRIETSDHDVLSYSEETLRSEKISINHKVYYIRLAGLFLIISILFSLLDIYLKKDLRRSDGQ